jgi:ABC-2 type transport system ATP-binding protein
MHVKNLHFRHCKKSAPFFHQLSFSLEKNKMHALHGKNGVGKSILLNCLSGKKKPGAILEGEISEKRVVLVNQRFDQMIADDFSFRENMRFSLLSSFPHPFRSLREPVIPMDLLQRFHIDLDAPVHQLSGGQRQILSLLMVLERPVSVLALDEPTAALDEENAALVFEFLSLLTHITLLVVAHDTRLLSRYVTGSHYILEIDTEGIRQIKKLK